MLAQFVPYAIQPIWIPCLPVVLGMFFFSTVGQSKLEKVVTYLFLCTSHPENSKVNTSLCHKVTV